MSQLMCSCTDRKLFRSSSKSFLKEIILFWPAFFIVIFLQCQHYQPSCCFFYIYYPHHSCISTDFSGFFSCLLTMLILITPTPLTLGVIFSPHPKSPCGLKSNLSDFTYDGLKQISVFKALKVMWEKWFACKDHICCSLSAPSSAPYNVLWWLSNEQSELSWCAWRWLLFLFYAVFVLYTPFLVFVMIHDFPPFLTRVILHAKL